MKIKSILRIAAFSAAFIFSAAFANLFAGKSDSQTKLFVPFKTETAAYDSKASDGIYDAREKSAAVINYVLQKDDDNGGARDRIIRRISPDYKPPFESDSAFDAFADATARYAGQSGRIAQSDLSPEFKSAWRRHMKAWRDYADFLQAMKISAGREELGKASFDEFDGEYGDEINQSWYQVLRLADANGADTEKYRRNLE